MKIGGRQGTYELGRKGDC